MPRISHIKTTETDMAMTTMCPFTCVRHGMPHWKFVL